MHQIIMAHGTGLKKRFSLTEQPGWHEEAIKRISGLSHHYREAISAPAGLAEMSGPRAGERAPDAILSHEPGQRISDLLRHPRYTLLLIPADDSASESEACRELVANISERWDSAIRCVIVGAGNFEGIDSRQLVPDETGETAFRYGRSRVGRTFLVRPDGYIGFRCQLAERQHLLKNLQQWLN